jgi:hypothetical protein
VLNEECRLTRFGRNKAIKLEKVKRHFEQKARWTEQASWMPEERRQNSEFVYSTVRYISRKESESNAEMNFKFSTVTLIRNAMFVRGSRQFGRSVSR